MQQPLADLRPSRRSILWLVLALTGFVFFTALYVFTFHPAPMNSDDAASWLQGIDIAHGNWRLSGWTLPPDNFVTGELSGQAILYSAFGARPLLTTALTAMMWSSVAILSFVIAVRALNWKAACGATIITATLVALPATRTVAQVSHIPIHVSTIAYALVSFWIADLFVAASGTTLSRLIRLCLLALVLMAGCFGDPLMLVIASLPLILGAALRFRINRPEWRYAPIFLTALIASLLGRALVGLNERHGGFRSVSLGTDFASFQEAFENLGFAVRGMTTLLGGDIFGHSMGPGLSIGLATMALRAVLGLAMLIAVFSAAWMLLRELALWPSTKKFVYQMAFLDLLIFFSFAAGVIAPIIFSVIVNDESQRYFLPPLVFGSILVARQFSAVPIFCLIGSLALVGSITLQVERLAQLRGIPGIGFDADWRLLQSLRSHGLYRGYAGYWHASILTVLSGQSVTSLALIPDETGRLTPFLWLSKRDWYLNAADTWSGKIFVLASIQPEGSAVTEDQVIKTFGRPDYQFDESGVTVNAYTVGEGTLRQLRP